MMNQKTVFISGNFNILHPGHQRLINFARDFGERLVIGVNSDETSGVLFPTANKDGRSTGTKPSGRSHCFERKRSGRCHSAARAKFCYQG